MSKTMSPQLEDKIKRYQAMQSQLSSIQQQIHALKIEQLDIEKALKEIDERNDDETCYRSIGRLMVLSTIKDTKIKLADQKELTNTRIDLSEKSLKKLKTQNDELETEIKAALESSK